MSRLKTFAGLKKGTKIKVLDNSNSHNYPVGKVFTMRRDGRNVRENDIAEEISYGNEIKAIDCELSLATKESLETRLAEIQEEFLSEQKEILTKLQFLKDTGAKEYDEDVFKVYAVLQSLKTHGDDIAKAQAIAKIITK